MEKQKIKRKAHFHVIELLLFISIIFSLFVLVFISLDPVKRMKEDRDIKRKEDIEAIVSAIHANIIKNNGAMPQGLYAGMQEVQIGTSNTGCSILTGGCMVTNESCLDLSKLLSSSLNKIPFDPKRKDPAKTNYTVSINLNGLVTVKACDGEQETVISVSR